MKTTDLLGKRRFASLEIVPPLKGVTRDELIESVKPFIEFAPPFINVTCHRDEVEYVKFPDGSYKRRVLRRRASQSAVCSVIKEAFGVEPVPHLICGGADADRIEDQLEDFSFLGFNNILALRGDSTAEQKRFTPEPDGYNYACELVKAIRDFSSRTGKEFCTGVAGYPEKHFEAPNLETDIANLKTKVDAGADYVVTQMFYDNKTFYDFCDKCREAGISVPVIPGLKPISSIRQLTLLPETFSLDIPQDLVKEIRSHEDDADAVYRIGLEWCAAQCEDLLAHGYRTIHFYTMGRTANICEILKRYF